MVTDEHLTEVASILWVNLYETAFQGVRRGAFTLSKSQLLMAMGTNRLDPYLFHRLQSACLATGLYIADLDEQFACIGLDEITDLRRVPKGTFTAFFDGDTREVKRRAFATRERNFLDEDDDAASSSDQVDD